MNDLVHAVDALTKRLGEKLRQARKEKGLTLGTFSARTGLSPGFLSRLERGEANASIANLIVISTELGVSLSNFFEDNHANTPPQYVLTRAQDRDSATRLSGGGYASHLITGDVGNDQLSAFEVVYFPGELTNRNVLTHKGEEVLYLLEGTVEFRIGDHCINLHGGDCIHFSSELPHEIRCDGPNMAKLLMFVITSDYIRSVIPERASR